MKKSFILLGIGLACMTTFTACKKTTSTTPNGNSAPSVNAPSGADGALAAVKVITTQTVAGYTVPIEIGTAAAWFGTASSYQDAGNVTIDTKGLTKSSNAYVYQPTQSDPTGLSFNSTVAWNVTGNTGNGIAAFSYNDVSSFPSIDDISNSGTVSSSAAFTLSATSGVYGDSVIFVVTGSQNHISFIAPGGTTSHTFTAAEMATVGAAGNNTGLLQIAPYRLNHQTIGGKSYYFIKETCVSKFVTIN